MPSSMKNDGDGCTIPVLINIKPNSVIKVINSIQKDNNEIRSTMVPTMLKVVCENKNDFDNFGTFEIGRVVKELNEDGTVLESKSLSIALASKGNREELLSGSI